MVERSSLLVQLASAIDELLQSVASVSAEIRRIAESEGSPDGLSQLAELLAAWLDRAEGPGLASLRQALRQELLRWEPRAGRDPSAARVWRVIAGVLEVLEPEPGRAGREPEAAAPAERGGGTRGRERTARGARDTRGASNGV
jgi:hypothetical protein